MKGAIPTLGVCVAAALLMGGALGCSSLSVNSDWDSEEDFSRLRTYMWLPGPQPKTGDIRLDNPLLDTRLRQAIDYQFATQGYEKIKSGQPDFRVGYHLSTQKKLDVRTVNNYYGYGWGAGWGYAPMGYSDTYVDEYDMGTVILDIVDTKLNRLVWRGSASGRLRKKSSPEENEKDAREVAKAILERFPPKVKGGAE
ncbi:MAG: DUF4136 domain-containing protein [Deltaproteobacteria bacterium]|nr:DUF4136 domain-containing protein [Deltaproteobacteria bacterium]MBW2418496.1 DUF4136 domain-containing protein [Deltaproteobacteria bacterium]